MALTGNRIQIRAHSHSDYFMILCGVLYSFLLDHLHRYYHVIPRLPFGLDDLGVTAYTDCIVFDDIILLPRRAVCMCLIV